MGFEAADVEEEDENDDDDEWTSEGIAEDVPETPEVDDRAVIREGPEVKLSFLGIFDAPAVVSLLALEVGFNKELLVAEEETEVDSRLFKSPIEDPVLFRLDGEESRDREASGLGLNVGTGGLLGALITAACWIWLFECGLGILEAAERRDDTALRSNRVFEGDGILDVVVDDLELAASTLRLLDKFSWEDSIVLTSCSSLIISRFYL